MAMFSREVLSCEKPLAMFDDPALALEKEGSDTGGSPSKSAAPPQNRRLVGKSGIFD